MFSVGTFLYVGGLTAQLRASIDHGALVFLILHVSWKHTYLGDSKKYTTGLVHSYPGAFRKTKTHVFPGRTASFGSGSQRPAHGLHSSEMTRKS